MITKIKQYDVLMKIAKAIRDNQTINSLAKNTFGRPFNVIVGGYAQKLAGEDEAPFVWVFSDQEDSDVTKEGINTLIVKVVVGVCPLKDVPSTTSIFFECESILELLKSNVSYYQKILEIVGSEAEIHEQLEDLVEAESDLLEAIETSFETARANGVSGEWMTMLSNVSTFSESVQSFIGKHEEIVDLVNVSVYTEAKRFITMSSDNVSAIEHSHCPVLAEDITKFLDDLNSYEENPYVSRVETKRTDANAGLVVYGAVTMFDDFREELFEILNGSNFGLPLVKMTCRNQSMSHYPLDWNEITVRFERQETLSL